jgi:hypothetical protein
MCLSLQSSKISILHLLRNLMYQRARANWHWTGQRRFEVGKASFEDQSALCLIFMFIEGHSTETSGEKSKSNC